MARLRRLVPRNRGQAVRFALTVLLVSGFILGAVSLGTAWWTYTSTTGNTTYLVEFLPGTQHSVSCSGSGCGGFAQGSLPYSAYGGTVGDLYASVEGGLIGAVVLAGLATLCGLWTIHRRVDRRIAMFGLIFGLAAGAVLLGLSAGVPGAQPGSFGASDSFPGLPSGGASPSGSFWGAANAGGSSASWGAGPGWYCALIGGLFLFAVAVALVVLRRDLPARTAATEDRGFAPVTAKVATSSAVYAPTTRSASPTVSPRSYTAPPAERPVQATAKTPAPVLLKPKSTAPEPKVDCPACGYQNSTRARICAYCQRPVAPSVAA